ncbi:hypothetical protein MBLNU230_g0003t1 [Neophaeotheca triangularis]
MATLAPSSSTSAPPPFHRRRKSWGRRIERVCCSTLSMIPLCFVYSLTTWAVWVEVNVSFLDGSGLWNYFKAALGVLLYLLGNTSYTIAVFTSAGSPLDARRDGSSLGRSKGDGYASLPTYEDEEPREASIVNGMSTVMAKSTGKQRYCKKCQSVKPDRTHHCSTCGTCVLKMDHHCPWLATCVGLRNYKAFVLFLVYTTLFCWVDFGVSARWVWAAILDDRQMKDGLMVVNTIVLAVISGVIGLVLGGFTGWHLYLATTGQTTIESLEKNRYISPLKQTMQQNFQDPARTYLTPSSHVGGGQPNEQSLGDQLKEIHANAVPGVFRPEEGETSQYPSSTSTPSPAPPPAPQNSHPHSHPEATSSPNSSPAESHLRTTYASLETQREHDRYYAYLDEQDSAKLPNAFDLGWKRNLLHLFGPRPLFWWLPICNTTGDGWKWEVSTTWQQARDEIARSREASTREAARWGEAGPPAEARSLQGSGKRDLKWTPGVGFVDRARGRPLPPKMSSSGMESGRGSPVRRLQQQQQLQHGGVDGARELQLLPLERRRSGGSAEYESSEEEEGEGWPGRQASMGAREGGSGRVSGNWNDLPEDFVPGKRGGYGSGSGGRSRSSARRKGD